MIAIISRLHFTYANKRPAPIIEQEMNVLRQGTMPVIEFYSIINSIVTLIINKIIINDGTDSDQTKEINNINRRNALRFFITELNAPLCNILFSLRLADWTS